MSQSIYAKGLFANTPSDGAPDYSHSRLSIKVDDFIEFLKANVNAKGYVNLDVNKGKEQGKLIAKLNTYVKLVNEPNQNPF